MWRVVCHYAWSGKWDLQKIKFNSPLDEIQHAFGWKSTYFEKYENLFGNITKTI